MDRVNMGFGPISDVTGFSHRGGMTFLQIQERLRKAINELIAWSSNMVTHVESVQAEWIHDFKEFQDLVAVPVDQYNAMILEVDTRLTELATFATQNTNYANQFNTALNAA